MFRKRTLAEDPSDHDFVGKMVRGTWLFLFFFFLRGKVIVFPLLQHFVVAHGRSDDPFYAADELKYHGPNRWKSSFGKYFYFKKCVDVL